MGRRLLGLIALAAVLGGCGSGSGAGEGDVSVQVETAPFRITVLRGGEPVIRQDADARLRYQLLSTGEQHSLTDVISSDGDVYRVATDEPGRTATVRVTRSDDAVRISVRVRPATNVQQVFDAFESAPDDHFLGGGERSGGADLRGQIVQVEVSAACAYAPVPFFASSAGWGLRLPTQRVSAFAFPGSSGGTGCTLDDGPACTFPPLERRTEVCVRGAALDEELYLGGFAELLDAYAAHAGRPKVPPPEALELVKWRDEVSGPGEVLEDIDRLREAGVPVGAVIVDNPWETCVGELRFDPARFPDPQELVRRVHARGVRLLLWVSPRLYCPAGYPSSQRLEASGIVALDLRKPAAVAELRARIARLVALGVDGVKADRGDEQDLESLDPELQNRYPLLFARAVMAALPRDAVAIFRAAAMGSQSVVPALWAGDQPGDWDGLERAIHSGLSASMSGFPTWGSDVGGYSSAGLTPEQFARWAQLGAISPVMEVGGNGPNATPWVLGEEAMEALRVAAVLHYELFPYLYGLLERREPVLRPLGYAYPDDPAAWAAGLELLVGPDLLAAPPTRPGTKPSVYLPEGTWIDLFSGEAVSGGGSVERPTPLTEFPLYARDGAVIPFNLRTTDSWWGPGELRRPDRAGFLATPGAELDLEGQPSAVQIFVPTALPPRRVTLGGEEVDWTWHRGPIPGVVVRVAGPDVQGRIVLEGA